jgi:hypothetical protein
MPGVQVGVYAGQQDAGTEVSSTYEGRHLTVREDELIHPYIADGFVNKGDPVVLCDAGVPTTYGIAVGVALASGTAAADWIAIDTEGIWNLTVYAVNDAGNVAIEIGDSLYIRAGSLPGAADGDGTGDAEISKIADPATQVFFGYALGSMVAGGSGRIAVKVHFSDQENWLMDDEKAYWGADSDFEQSFNGTYRLLAASVATPAMADGYGHDGYELTVTGLATGGIYARSAWINLSSGSTVPAYMFVHTDGIWDGGATLTTAAIAWAKYTCMLASNPAWCSLWELNFDGANSEIDSIFNCNNMILALGYQAGTPTKAAVGSIPFCSDAHGGLRYIYLYDEADAD